MKIGNRITLDQMNREENNFYRRGFLNLPLTIMFGLLGFRPGQILNKIVGYFINLMFFFNYGSVLAVTVARITNVKEYYHTINKFFTGFAVIMTIKFTILIHIFFKRYNFVCLLKDISNKRKHSLSKKELLFVWTIFIATVTMVICIVYHGSYVYVLPVLKTGYHYFNFAFKIKKNSLLIARTTVIFEYVIFMNSTWISIIATSVLVNVIAVVLRREFDKCIENLQEKINETGLLSGDTFSETVQRFQELRVMVEKVDDMFFLDFALNLCLSLGILCSSIYGIYTGDFAFENETIHLKIQVSIVTLLITLPASAALHSKVNS